MFLNIFKRYGKLLCALFGIVFVCLHTYTSQAQSISLITTPWNVTIPPIAEAGSDYTGTYESATNQTAISLGIPLLLGYYKVGISYQAMPLWNSALQLSVQRTTSGNPGCLLCNVSGGGAYQNITLTDTELFRVRSLLSLLNYTDIQVQYKLSGVSVTIPAANYQSRIVYTVSEL